MRHLNIEQSEAVRVIVDYEINRFVVYLEINSGSKIVFLANYDWSAIAGSDEFIKYAQSWCLPIEFSSIAHAQKIKQLKA